LLSHTSFWFTHDIIQESGLQHLLPNLLHELILNIIILALRNVQHNIQHTELISVQKTNKWLKLIIRTRHVSFLRNFTNSHKTGLVYIHTS
jgi:hypothetical protein